MSENKKKLYKNFFFTSIMFSFRYSLNAGNVIMNQLEDTRKNNTENILFVIDFSFNNSIRHFMRGGWM